DLAKQQADIASKAEQMKLEQAGEPAAKAAEALKQGDLDKALVQQEKALAKLQEATSKSPMPMPGEAKAASTAKQRAIPAEAKEPGQRAQAQKEVMDATEALAKSQQATQAAQAALAQAQAQAPKAVQPQLQEASKQLAQANQQLQKAAPMQAGEAQKQAAQQL